MKNTTIFVIIAIILIVGGIWIFSSKGSTTGDVVSSGDSDAQRITLGIKNHNYYPNTITVKSGSPVEITLDSSVVGCFRSFNIKELGVSHYSTTPSDKVIFTPQQKGTYRFACSMGMGYGTIIIE